MNLYYVMSFVVAGFGIIGCSTEKPDLFVDTHFIRFQFCKPQIEDYYRFTYSFTSEMNQVKEREIRMPVLMMGQDLSRNLYFGVEVDKSKTTLPDDCFQLELLQPFRPGFGNVDSLKITFFRKPVLRDSEKMLRLKLVNSNDFQLFMSDSSYVEIHVDDIFLRPGWWNYVVEKAYLGVYSKKKYDEFVKETGVTDFGNLTPSEKRHYAILFKRELEKNPRRDEDGGYMTVAIAG